LRERYVYVGSRRQVQPLVTDVRDHSDDLTGIGGFTPHDNFLPIGFSLAKKVRLSVAFMMATFGLRWLSLSENGLPVSIGTPIVAK
jgi:hypothetical protein